jgi:hypothetical protein
VIGSGGGRGTRTLTGSQPMRVHTCFAYSSSIQGSRSPQQTEEREDEMLGDEGWRMLRTAVLASLSLGAKEL